MNRRMCFHQALLLAGIALLLHSAAQTADAALRQWTGAGPNALWSTPSNWNPAGPPQNGEDLIFPAGTPRRTSTNDLPARTFGFLFFNGAGSDFELRGNGITLSGGVSAINTGLPNDAPQIILPITLAQDLQFVADLGNLGVGNIALAGHTLTLNTTSSNSLVSAGGEISGVGDVVKIGVGEVLFGGAFGNSYQGTTHVVEGTLRLGKGNAGPPHGVPGPLIIGDLNEDTFFVTTRGRVELLRSEMIEDSAPIEIRNGTLALDGFDETIGPVEFRNGSIATGTGTLFLRDTVTTGRIFPLTTSFIGGRVVLQNNINFRVGGEGLNISANVSGPGGIIKEGAGKLTMQGTNSFNTFTGPLTVNNGTLFLWDAPFALNGVPGVTLNGTGRLSLREVSFAGKALTLNSPDTSFVTEYQPSTWNGPIQLNFTGMAQFIAGDLAPMRILGSIGGTGGIWFGGGDVELLANNTFTGPVRSACELLTLNTGGGKPFSGPLEVGGVYPNLDSEENPFLARVVTNEIAEVRWFRDRQNPNQPLTVRSNGFVNLNGRSEDFRGITFHGGRVSGSGSTITLLGPVVVKPENATAHLSGNIVLPDALANVSFAVSNTLVATALFVDGNISGPGGITKQGPGLMWIEAPGSYLGSVMIEGGALHANSATALGTRGAGTTVQAGGTLSLGFGAEFMGEPLVLEGSGSPQNFGALRSAFDIFITNNVVLTGPTTIHTEGTGSRIQIQGAISGTGPLTKTGSGVFGFRGNTPNTYQGETFAREGVTRLAKANGVISVPGDLTIGGSGGLLGASAVAEQGASFAIRGSVTVNSGGLWDLNGFNESFDPAALGGRPPLTLNGGGDVQTGAGTLSLPVGGDVVVNPGNGLGLTSLISGNLGLDPGPHRFVVGSGPSIIGFDSPELEVSAAISQTSTAAELLKEGFGEMRLSASNSFAGPVTVNSGLLNVAHPSALGGVAGGTFVHSNASLGLSGGIAVNDESLTLDSTNSAALVSLGPVTNVWSGNIVLQRTAGVRVTDARGGLTHSGLPGFGTPAPNISGPGGLNKSGPGALFIGAGAGNSYLGLTTVSDGLLEALRGRSLCSNIVVTGPNAVLRTGLAGLPIFAARTVLPFGASVTVEDGALWAMNGTNFETVSRLVGDGRLVVSTAGSLTISNSVSCEFSGQISGSGALNKLGIATLQLTGNSPGYTGTATVFDGAYKVDGSIPNSPVTTKVSSVLRGTGTVGDVTVESGLLNADPDSPGQRGGTFNLNSVNFLGGGILDASFFGPHPTGGNDQLFVNNAVTLTSAQLSLDIRYPVREGDVFTVITKDSAGPISGNFSGWPEGVVRVSGGVPVRASYLGGDGNDFTLTVTNLPLQGGGAALVTSAGGPLGPDDCSQLWLAVTNRSGSTLTGLRGQLRSLTDGVVVTRAESAYPNLGPNARGTNIEPFQIRTESSFPCGGSVQFELVLTASNTTPLAIAYTMTGASGSGLDFDGRNDLVQLPVNAFAGVSNNFTIELWANSGANRTESAETNTGPSGVNVALRQLQRFAVFPDRGDLAYGATHASAGISIGRNGISVYEHSTNAAQGTLHLPSRLVYSNSISGWTHVALVYANRRPRLYVNGVLERSSSVQSLFPFVHASGSLGGSSQGNFGNFDGQLDEVRIWNTALSAEQIQTNMLRSLTGTEPNLVTYFRCDAGRGTALVDNAPANPNPSGTLIGGAAFVMPGVVPFGPACGSSGGACESCFVVSGQFDTNAIESVRRIVATGLPSICDPPKPCPDFEEFPADPVRHVLHSFTNETEVEICVTAQLRPACAIGVGEMGTAAYLGEFRVNQPCAGFLGDDGAGAANPPPFSFRVPPRTNFLIAVTARTTNLLCDSYALELFGLPCAPPVLSIAKDLSPDVVRLHWSSAYPEFRLQSANALNNTGSTDFNHVSTPPVLLNGRFVVTNAVISPSQFFRLRSP